MHPHQQKISPIAPQKFVPLDAAERRTLQGIFYPTNMECFFQKNVGFSDDFFSSILSKTWGFSTYVCHITQQNWSQFCAMQFLWPGYPDPLAWRAWRRDHWSHEKSFSLGRFKRTDPGNPRRRGPKWSIYIYIYVYPPGNLGKRKIVFKMPFLGDMLVPWRVYIYIYMGVSKNRGVSPKMDGENNGKPY